MVGQGGASEDPPEAKWENWWHNRVDLALQELQNLGQLIWFTDAPYQAGARVSHGGNSYIALSENTGVEPTGTLDIGVWRKEGASTYLQTANNLAEIAAAGPAAVADALKNLTLTDMGIGLPNMPVTANFDWQNFVFTSGANYLTAYNTWINPPAGMTYNAGTNVSITVDYAYGNRVGLTIIPDTGAQTNFHVFKVLCVGAAGSRVFTFREEWNSANLVPITGGGTGGKTAAEALVNLGIGSAGLLGTANNARMAAGTSTALLPTVAAVMSLFSKRSFAVADYIRIPDVPGGVIIQWGKVGPYLTNTSGSTSATVTLPIAFPTAFLAGFTGVNGGLPGSLSSTIDSPPLVGPITNFVQRFANTRTDQAVYSYWLAIGY
ncbi:hypothetical protein ACLMPK_12500 [Yersinia enterocolitica]|uniref:gp53-like domain-containing protein n=1 Tax=Yersinia enterocolitica TaxID=630 RepID=UPI00398CAA95